MDFLLWAARSLHVFAVVVWLGGLTYQSVVTLAVTRVEGAEIAPLTLHMLRRFLPFVSMCVWTILITGTVLMMFGAKFVFFQFTDRWSVLLALKQLVFLLMVLYSFGYARMFSRIVEMTTTGEQTIDEVMPFQHRMVQFGRINVGLGIIGLLLAEGMR